MACYYAVERYYDVNPGPPIANPESRKVSLRTPNSIIASWVLLIAHAIDDYGFDSRQLFQQAGSITRGYRNPARVTPTPPFAGCGESLRKA
ncbi:MAG: hypothetical protein GY783_21475 [Gammaproteobacteria bacterium]|nr:hypothetical protein [Gammaproteobacteria bacterium]MCP4874142.1 hypothetical protein [Gammaproteobacteria bacterium]